MPQTPSLGRVVLVLVAPVTNNGSDVAPATIVRVSGAPGAWSVNLKVDLDGATTAKWLTSVGLFDTEEAARQCKGFAAFWPPRAR